MKINAKIFAAFLLIFLQTIHPLFVYASATLEIAEDYPDLVNDESVVSICIWAHRHQNSALEFMGFEVPENHSGEKCDSFWTDHKPVDISVLKARYRELVLKWHSDKFGNKDLDEKTKRIADEMFKQSLAAYNYLQKIKDLTSKQLKDYKLSFKVSIPDCDEIVAKHSSLIKPKTTVRNTPKPPHPPQKPQQKQQQKQQQKPQKKPQLHKSQKGTAKDENRPAKPKESHTDFVENQNQKVQIALTDNVFISNHSLKQDLGIVLPTTWEMERAWMDFVGFAQDELQTDKMTRDTFVKQGKCDFFFKPGFKKFVKAMTNQKLFIGNHDFEKAFTASVDTLVDYWTPIVDNFDENNQKILDLLLKDFTGNDRLFSSRIIKSLAAVFNQTPRKKPNTVQAIAKTKSRMGRYQNGMRRSWFRWMAYFKCSMKSKQKAVEKLLKYYWKFFDGLLQETVKEAMAHLTDVNSFDQEVIAKRKRSLKSLHKFIANSGL